MKRIAVATDFSDPSARAVELAGHLAKAAGAALRVIHVHDPMPEGVLGSESIERQRQDSEARAAGVKAEVQRAHPELDVELEVVADEDVVGAICGLAESADLLVVASIGRTGLRRFLLGSVAERVVRKAPCPVWVARGATHRPPSRVQVCTDLSSPAEEGVRLAAELVDSFGARVELVHVEPEPPGTLALEAQRDLQKQRKTQLESLSRTHLTGRDVRLTLLPGGSPVQAITTHAERTSPHVLVLATHGRTGVGRFLLGSVAERVVRYAPCAVLIARRAEE